MTLAREIRNHADAGFGGMWVLTDEVADAQDEIIRQCNRSRMLCLSWSLDEGLQARDEWTRQWLKQGNVIEAVDKPDDMLKVLPVLSNQLMAAQLQNPVATDGPVTKPLDPKSQRVLLLLPNFHMRPFVESAKLTQQLARLPIVGKSMQFAVVILSHSSKIPPEYEKLFVILKHSLPDDEELTRIAKRLPGSDDALIMPAVHSARGLTRLEAENAFALTVFEGKPFDPQTVWDLKAQMIEKSGLMSIYKGNSSADNMGGLDHFFSYAESLLTGYDGKNPLLRPRGLLLVGVPGGGKSEAVKALGNRTGRRIIETDPGRLMGGLVGDTESNTRRMLSIVDAMAPCILFMDEIEKALAGTTGGGKNDGGVGARLLGTLLTWLNDHQTDVFFIGTCNDAENLPSALTRAERFDAKFFFDFPGAKARLAIWNIYLKMFDLPIPPVGQNAMVNLIQKSANWTGAEIRSCCRLAAIQKRPVAEVAGTVVPVSKMYAGVMSSLRKWAQGNCLAADREGVYSLPQEETYQSMAAAVSGNGEVVPGSRVIKQKKKLKLSVK